MKNYIVKALINFDDYEGLDATDPQNPHIWRERNSIFNCTKERYEYLDFKKAVKFMGIEKKEESDIKSKEEKKETKPIKKKKEK